MACDGGCRYSFFPVGPRLSGREAFDEFYLSKWGTPNTMMIHCRTLFIWILHFNHSQTPFKTLPMHVSTCAQFSIQHSEYLSFVESSVLFFSLFLSLFSVIYTCNHFSLLNIKGNIVSKWSIVSSVRLNGHIQCKFQWSAKIGRRQFHLVECSPAARVRECDKVLWGSIFLEKPIKFNDRT